MKPLVLHDVSHGVSLVHGIVEVQQCSETYSPAVARAERYGVPIKEPAPMTRQQLQELDALHDAVERRAERRSKRKAEPRLLFANDCAIVGRTYRGCSKKERDRFVTILVIHSDGTVICRDAASGAEDVTCQLKDFHGDRRSKHGFCIQGGTLTTHPVPVV